MKNITLGTVAAHVPHSIRILSTVSAILSFSPATVSVRIAFTFRNWAAKARLDTKGKPILKSRFGLIAKGRYRVLENGKPIREYTNRAAATRYVKKIKAEISEEIKHETATENTKLQRITRETDTE
jgi:hypothetical protein